MNKNLYKELWRIRFSKMLILEKQSIGHYQDLLTECQSKNMDHPVEQHLERLITDEKKHTALVEELLSILDRQP